MEENIAMSVKSEKSRVITKALSTYILENKKQSTHLPRNCDEKKSLQLKINCMFFKNAYSPSLMAIHVPVAKYARDNDNLKSISSRLPFVRPNLRYSRGRVEIA